MFDEEPVGRPRDERCDQMAAAVKAGARYLEVAAKFGVSEAAVARACKVRGVRSVRSRAYRECWQHRLKASEAQTPKHRVKERKETIT